MMNPCVLPLDPLEAGHKLIRLWVHEVYRVFHDRLITPEERDLLLNFIRVFIYYLF